MAKGAESAGSDKAEIKKWLNRADAGEINMAFAFGKDGKAVLKLDGHKAGRALEKTIKDGAPDSKNHRHGTVRIDPDNPDTVQFVVNKAVGGATGKLVIALKGSGFSKVKIVMEDGSPGEDAKEGDDDSDADSAAGGQDASGGASADGSVSASDGDSDGDDSGDSDSGSDASAAPADDADTGDDTSQAPSLDAGSGDGDAGDQSDGDASTDAGSDGKAAAPDASELTKQLTGLVKQMMGVIQKDPTQKAALTGMATDAQASLKRGDLDSAAAGLEIFRQGLADVSSPDSTAGRASGDADSAGAGANGAGGQPSPPAGAPARPDPPMSGVDSGAAQKLQKSRAVWTATRGKIEADLKKLDKAVQDSAQGDGEAAELKKLLQSVIEPVLSNLDESLSHTLDKAASAKDEAERRKHLEDAKTTIGSYQQFVEGNKMLSHLDSNPFVPMNIVKMITASLAALTAAVH